VVFQNNYIDNYVYIPNNLNESDYSDFSSSSDIDNTFKKRKWASTSSSEDYY